MPSSVSFDPARMAEPGAGGPAASFEAALAGAVAQLAALPVAARDVSGTANEWDRLDCLMLPAGTGAMAASAEWLLRGGLLPPDLP